VGSFRTDVMGVAAWPDGPVGRCLGAADASLSLSLSLSGRCDPGLSPGHRPNLSRRSRAVLARARVRAGLPVCVLGEAVSPSNPGRAATRPVSGRASVSGWVSMLNETTRKVVIDEIQNEGCNGCGGGCRGC